MNPQHEHDPGVLGDVCVHALGVVIRLSFDESISDDLRAEVVDAWSGARAKDAEAATTVAVPPGVTSGHALESLSTRVTLAALGARRGTSLLFHAAGVAMEDGRVIAFVGPSGRGKTTLASVLGTHHGYVSDESIAVDPSLAVEPYRKPLSMVQARGPKLQVSPRAAGLLELPDMPLRLAALVLLQRDPDAARIRIERVPLLEAMTELLPETSFTASLDLPLQQLARLIDQVGGVQRLTYGDAAEVPAAVEELLHHVAHTEFWQPANAAAPSGGSLHLGDISDAISCPGGVAVFREGVFRLLGGIAPDIWRAVSAGDTFDAIVDGVIARHGVPVEGDPTELVSAAIDALVTEGLMRRSA